MICVSLLESSLDALMGALKDVEFAEIRLEEIGPSAEDVARIFSMPGRFIATMRPGKHDDAQRAETLVSAVEAGAAYVDVEFESPKWLREQVIETAERTGCKVIVSFHDYEGTPEKRRLEEIVNACFDAGADIAKVACTVSSSRESARLLALLDTDRPVIALGMGEAGRVTRVVGPLLGSPFTFASRAPGHETAKGQIDAHRLDYLIGELNRG